MKRKNFMKLLTETGSTSKVKLAIGLMFNVCCQDKHDKEIDGGT